MQRMLSVLSAFMLLAFVGTVVHASDADKADDKPKLYTDDEAKKLIKPAEAVVPIRETRSKKRSLKT